MVTRTLLIAIVLSLGPLRAARAGEGLNPEWIRLDERLINNVALPLLRGPLGEVGRLKKKYGLTPTNPKDRGLGLGYSVADLTSAGGYATVQLVGIYRGGGQLVRGVVYVSASPEAWPTLDAKFGLSRLPGARLHENLRAAIIVPFANDQFGDEMSRQFSEHFRAPMAGVVTEELGAEFALLTDPLSSGAYGDRCGIIGVSPQGREAMQRLRDEGRKDLLLAIASSPSPEGRMYAFEALGSPRFGKDLPPGLLDDLVERAASLRAEVKVCSGCMFSHERPSTGGEVRTILREHRGD